MARRNDREGPLPRDVERPQFGAYDGEGNEHGEPREFRYGSGFDKPEHGRWAGQRHVDAYSRPYDEWNHPGYVFYAGQGYHREFIDAYAGPAEAQGGVGWQIAPESRRGPFAGRGPKGYVRSDERIREDVNDRLLEHAEIDATEIDVSVSDREVTLEGAVDDKRTKRLAEDVAESVRGVHDVHNRLRVAPRGNEIDVDVHGPESHSGTGFLTENRETSRTRLR
jgi:osmotically-inducible protein OsmY